MKILFVGKRFYTNRDALLERFGRIYQLPLHWSRAGHETTLWLLDYHTKDRISRRDGDLAIFSAPALSIATARFALSQRALKFSEAPQLVVASGDSYLGFIAYRLARAMKAAFVFDVYDKYDEFPTYHRWLGFDSYHYLLGRADVRLFASRALLQSVEAQIPGHNVVIENGVDTERFRPVDQRSARMQLGLPLDATFVGYFGGMDEDRGVSDLLTAIAVLREDGLNAIALLAGKRAAVDIDRPYVNFLGNLDHATIPLAMAACDVLALPSRRSGYLDMAASCKIAEYLAMQRPIAATRTPNFSSNFPLQAGQLSEVLAQASNPSDIARVIAQQLRTPVIATFEESLDWAQIARQSFESIRAMLPRLSD